MDPDHLGALEELKVELNRWRIESRDPLLDPDNLRQLKQEIDESFVNGKPRKNKLQLNYPDYFLDDSIPRR